MKPPSINVHPYLYERDNVITLLEMYSEWLMNNGYLDTDWKCEPPFAIDEFMKYLDKKKGIRK